MAVSSSEKSDPIFARGKDDNNEKPSPKPDKDGTNKVGDAAEDDDFAHAFDDFDTGSTGSSGSTTETTK